MQFEMDDRLLNILHVSWINEVIKLVFAKHLPNDFVGVGANSSGGHINRACMGVFFPI